jgi:hypothetical protein
MMKNKTALETVHSLTYSTLVELAWWTGSRYICNPPVMNTDVDIVCFTQKKGALQAELWLDGWGENGSRGTDSRFSSFKKAIGHDIYNLIITCDITLYLKYCAATELAKKMNLLEKDTRIGLFNIILDGETDDDDVPF